MGVESAGAGELGEGLEENGVHFGLRRCSSGAVTEKATAEHLCVGCEIFSSKSRICTFSFPLEAFDMRTSPHFLCSVCIENLSCFLTVSLYTACSSNSVQVIVFFNHFNKKKDERKKLV